MGIRDLQGARPSSDEVASNTSQARRALSKRAGRQALREDTDSCGEVEGCGRMVWP